MKKRQLAALSALILTVSIIFCGCNFDFEIGGKEKTSETALSDVSASGEDVGGEDVTIIENVTDEEGKVISSEAKVLENDEVKDGKDFYDIGEKKELDDKISVDKIKRNQDETVPASSSEQPRTEKTTGEKEPQGNTTEPAKPKKRLTDEEIINSKNYYVHGRMVNGDDVVEFKTAQKGNKLALITYSEGIPFGAIVDDENIYMINMETKTYFRIPKDFLLENVDGAEELSMLLSGEFVANNKKVVNEGKETVDGNKLTYKEYEDASRCYFSGDFVIFYQNADGSKIIYDEISGNVSDGFFAPPAGSKELELTAENLEAFAASLGETVTYAQ